MADTGGKRYGDGCAGGERGVVVSVPGVIDGVPHESNGVNDFKSSSVTLHPLHEPYDVVLVLFLVIV